ncbi:hypothetical protein PIB30_016098 [Stylosanthes scabra]|uniref:Uncharacterized protein n=1 Tax=Stylosanthes scabra TaxID=79078 RepID=A0ABU6Q7U0_9FABA|nr:hypothetical protein [Stylosanthes scabra]
MQSTREQDKQAHNRQLQTIHKAHHKQVAEKKPQNNAANNYDACLPYAGHELMRRLITRNPTLFDTLLTGYDFPTCVHSAYVSNGPATYILTTFVSNGSCHLHSDTGNRRKA